MSSPDTDLDVSRETIEKLRLFQALLTKWNLRINLVAPSTIAESWTRHIIDSAQLWSIAPRDQGHWVDLGSGAGFPGLVLAILAREKAPNLTFSLVESDLRKISFLQTVSCECGLNATLVPERIETIPSLKADVLSARALAPLPKLLEFAEKHVIPGAICLFPKGEKVHKEIAEAEQNWHFDYRLHPSRTEEKAAIVEIGAFSRA